MKREYTKEAFAARLRSLIKGKNMTRAKAAQRCDISQPTFETYLYAQNQPSAAQLAKLSCGLQVPSDYLLFGTARAYG